MRQPNPPKLVTVIAMTTVTVVFWVFFALYKILVTKPAPSVNENLLRPLKPELDVESLQKIKNRIFFENEAPTTNQTTPAANKPTPTPTVANNAQGLENNSQLTQ
jgi:hypothetical protein